MNLKNIFISITFVTLLSGCMASNPPEKPKVISQQEIIKNEKEDMMWAMPSWCENLQQEPFQFKACGIAKSPNLQTSRTRSELDARKQISKILSNQCRSTERESTRNGNSVFNSTFTCETGEVSIKNALVRKRKTERVGTNFVTFTEMSLSYRFGN
ncbi:hypothetical protein OAS37_07055 [Alphaproteobacteria bacterium]|nr:hypothetical protein [Alphaproteobacteria bacterium]